MMTEATAPDVSAQDLADILILGHAAAARKRLARLLGEDAMHRNIFISPGERRKAGIRADAVRSRVRSLIAA